MAPRHDPVPIPLCSPWIGGNEWEYVKSCLDTGWVSTAGAFVERFEAEFAARLGVPGAVSTVTGTSALHVALRVAGVRPGDLVLVSTLTFIAPVNAIAYQGAVPRFVDAEPAAWQMDADAVGRILREECAREMGELVHRPTGRRVGAVVPVHVLGHPVDLDPILAACAERGVPVIEDATESLGGTYRGRTLGTLGDFGCFSFNGNKLLTTGGGGMLVARDPERLRRARHLATTAKVDPLEYVHDDVGYNYRLTNVQAAIGVAQLERIDAFLRRKREVFEAYNAAFAGMPGFAPMPEAPWARSACWMYTARFGDDSRPLLRHLASVGIQSRPLWQPIHQSPAYAHLPPVECPVADGLHRSCLSLPCSTHLTDAELARVIDAVRGFAAA